jgi:hypothetical protein
VNPSPRDSRRHPFPNPRDLFDASKKGKTAESDFVIFFPHDKHIEIVTARAAPRIFINAAFTRAQAEESCGVCHQTYKPQGDSPDEFFTKPPAKLGDGYWLKKGTFKTKPIDHARCFTCHSADSGLMPEPANCAVCHKIKPVQPPADIDLKTAAQMAGGDKIVMDSWRRRDSTGKFRHEFAVHAELSCSTCHTVAEMNTTLPATKRVKIASCSMCHATSTAEEGGALNIEIAERAKNAAFRCTKCHISFGGLPIPESHSKALAEATGQ